MRVRKSVLGLAALGIRESEPKQEPKQEFKWLFGVPSARQTKRGVRWTLRTPKRLQKIGLPEEREVGVAEGRLEGGKSELTSSFLKAVREGFAGREAYLLKILPGSEIERLLRGSLRAGDKPKRVELPLYVKFNARLEAVDLVRGKRGAYAVFEGERVPVKEEVSEKAAAAVKAKLESRGFKVLTVKVRRKKGRSEEHGEGGLYSVPWDFTAHASKFILARDRDQIVRRMLPYLLRAPPRLRPRLVEVMDRTRMALSGILDPQLKYTVQVGFKELKPWLMPRQHCETLEKFKESLHSLFRAFFLEPYNLKPGTVERCLHWWLYQDAKLYLRRLLEKAQLREARR
jgi:ribosomal protein S24E